MLRQCKVAIVLLISACTLGLAAVTTLNAQTIQGQINGTITDPSGNVVPGAEISLKSLDTNTGLSTTSSSSGVYFLPSVPPGRYSLSITVKGFENYVISEIDLTVNQSRTFDAQLTIGAVVQTVKVQASTTALNTTTADIGTVVGHQDIVEMPLNGRNFTQLTLLTPGAVPVQQGQASVFIITGGISPSVNGMRSRNNNFTLDGAENNQRFSNTYAQAPPPDAIAEFKVDSHETGADVSLAAGSNVNLVTRSGSNAFHGALWDFLRNDDVDANGFFNNLYALGRVPYRQNQFGYYVGGPVFIPKLIDGRKTRTYFSSYYEGLRFSQTSATTANVPNAAERTGNLSDLLGPQIGTDCLGRPVYQGEIYDITTSVANGSCPDGYVKNPYPNNTVPSINPVAQAYMTTFYPLPNRSTSPNLVLGQVYTQTADQFGARIDQSLSDRQQLFGRFSFYNWVDATPGGIPLNPYHGQNHGFQAVGHYTRTLSPSFVMDDMFAYNRSGIPIYFPGPGGTVGSTFDSAVGTNFYNHFNASGNLPNGMGLASSIFTSPFGGYSYELANPDYTYQENIDFKKIHGRHQMSFGFRYTHQTHVAGSQGAASQTFYPQTTGLAGFTQTGQALASFMAGYQEQSYSALWPQERDWGPVINGYFGDTWKVTPKFTLNLGLQYVYGSPPVFEQGGVQNAISALEWDLAIKQPTSTDFTYAYLWCSTNPMNGAPANCPRRSIMNPDRKNWAPRLGIAYALRNNTVIRTGFGMFYDFNDSIEQDSERVSSAEWPYSLSANYDNQNIDYLGPLSPVLSLSAPWPARTASPPPGSNQSINRFNKTPYAMEWNFGIEQLLPGAVKLSVDYVGSAGRTLPLLEFQNLAYLGSGSIASRKPVQNMATFSWIDNSATSNYNSLQMKVERSITSGLTFLNSFTWSKTLGEAGAYGSLQSPGIIYLRSLSYGPVDFDIPFMNVTSFVYNLPFGRGKRFGSNIGKIPDGILGGWESSGIITIRSGQHYNVLNGQDVANLGLDTGQLAQRVSAAVPSGFTQDRAHWFNPAAFQLPAFGTLGNTSPNFLLGPAYQNVDFALMKNFKITEALRLQFRAEGFNVLNLTKFGNPDGSLADLTTTYGQILSANPPRIIQFALKLLW